MGIGMSGGSAKSGLTGGLTPGAFGFVDKRAGTPRGQMFQKSAQLSQGLQALLETPFGQTIFGPALEQSVLSPQYGPTTASEEAFLNSISSLTQGASALRGLGPATQGALAQNLAPALMQLRQQQIGNIGQAIGLEQAQRAQTLQGLLSLIELAMPQMIAGQKSKESHFGLDAYLLPSSSPTSSPTPAPVPGIR